MNFEVKLEILRLSFKFWGYVAEIWGYFTESRQLL